MEINKRALNILLKYSPYEPGKTSKEDYQFAKDAGYMFDSVKQTHDEVMDYAFEELNKCDKTHLTNLFISSLSSSRPDWRAGLSAYAVMRVFPRHLLKSNGYNCIVCPSENEKLVKYTGINKTRYAKGAIFNGNIYELAFMLKQHNALQASEPTSKDFDIFKAIIEILETAEDNDGPSRVQGRLRGIDGFKSTKYQREGLLETLGFCSILETEKHKGFLHQYVSLGLAPRFRHSSDWLYPVDWWKGKDGVNKQALKYWFGEYKELQDLTL